MFESTPHHCETCTCYGVTTITIEHTDSTGASTELLMPLGVTHDLVRFPPEAAAPQALPMPLPGIIIGQRWKEYAHQRR